jgi:hypothetical protein
MGSWKSSAEIVVFNSFVSSFVLNKGGFSGIFDALFHEKNFLNMNYLY